MPYWQKGNFIMDKNIEMSFREEVKERKALVPSAHRKVSHRGCTLPCDSKSKADIKKLSGDCVTYLFTEPWSWSKFTTAPSDIQKEYLMALLKKYGITKGQLIQLFDCSQFAIDTYLKAHGLAGVLPSSFKEEAGWKQEKEWNAFVSTAGRKPALLKSPVKEISALITKCADELQMSQNSIAKRLGTYQAMVSRMKREAVSAEKAAFFLPMMREIAKGLTPSKQMCGVLATYAADKPTSTGSKAKKEMAEEKHDEPLHITLPAICVDGSAPATLKKSDAITAIASGKLSFNGPAKDLAKVLYALLEGSDREVAVELSFVEK